MGIRRAAWTQIEEKPKPGGSKRRAEAVKQVLVAEFQIDVARLTTDGLGATEPLESNETPQGRVQNRRVKLVKR
jgi:outer membrane protein OmpA-like peptidoglycan-associated protein